MSIRVRVNILVPKEVSKRKTTTEVFQAISKHHNREPLKKARPKDQENKEWIITEKIFTNHRRKFG